MLQYEMSPLIQFLPNAEMLLSYVVLRMEIWITGCDIRHVGPTVSRDKPAGLHSSTS